MTLLQLTIETLFDSHYQDCVKLLKTFKNSKIDFYIHDISVETEKSFITKDKRISYVEVGENKYVSTFCKTYRFISEYLDDPLGKYSIAITASGGCYVAYHSICIKYVYTDI